MTAEAANRLPIIPRDAAPIVFFDGVIVSAHFNQIVACTLSALVHTQGADGNAKTEATIVAYLRTNIQGAIALRKALDDALLLAAPVQGDAKN